MTRGASPYPSRPRFRWGLGAPDTLTLTAYLLFFERTLDDDDDDDLICRGKLIILFSFFSLFVCSLSRALLPHPGLIKDQRRRSRSVHL